MRFGRGVASAATVVLLAGCGGGTAKPSASPSAAPVAKAPVRVARTVRPRRAPQPARPAAPRYAFSAVALPSSIRTLMVGRSWHPGCPVGLDQLRYLRISYWDFDHRAHRGEMVVNEAAVAAVRRAFELLFGARFPIRRMRLVDRYGGSDFASIQADNTSSFNCRQATGSTSWSEHAYGEAIDINPIENPYVYANGTTSHRGSRPFLNRADVRPGMAVAGGTLVDAFKAVGWGWGGNWPLPTDFQHFSVNGR